jgi:hypothetical protein
VAGAKALVALMAAAAVPGWALGQPKPEPKPQPKLELKLDDLKGLLELKDLKLDVDVVQPKKPEPKVEFRFADVTPDNAKTKEIEARIAELTKQLEALRAQRAAAEKAKAAPPIEWKVLPQVGDGKSGILRLAPDGKVIELKDIELKLAPDGIKPGQPLKIELGGQPAKQPQVKVIGPDGKEIPGAKVIIDGKPFPAPPANAPSLDVQRKLEEARKALDLKLKLLNEPKSRPVEMVLDGLKVVGAAPAKGPAATKVINLTRATYSMPKEKAANLAAFLKDNIRATVMETKVEGDSLTVTTTPDVQNAIGVIAGLMQGQGGGQFRFRLITDGEKK